MKSHPDFLVLAWVYIHLEEHYAFIKAIPANSNQVTNLSYALLILVAGLDGLGHHVWDTTEAELPYIPRLLKVSRRLCPHGLSH